MYYTFYGSRDCVQKSWVTAFDSAASTTTSQHTVMMHEAWAVTWDASDTSTLTPQLPTLTSSMRVPKWTPGEKIPKGQYDPYHDYRVEYFSRPVLYFLMVGMPIIGALIMGSCVWYCVRKGKNRRAKKAAAVAREIELSANKE